MKPAASSEPGGAPPARPRRLLALDAAGSACSAAVWCDGRLAARSFAAMRRGQSERLVPMIQAVMAEAGLDFAALDAVAVTRGPGGFTGVRIGLATARALGLALAVPVIGVTSFEAVAAAVPAEQRRGRVLAVVLDAKRREVYVQPFDAALLALAPAAARAPEALAGALPTGPLLLAGDGAAQAAPALAAAGRPATLAEAPGAVDAAWVARLAAERPLPPPGPGTVPQPIYLREADVTLPAAGP